MWPYPKHWYIAINIIKLLLSRKLLELILPFYADRGARWVPLCWWHGKGSFNRRENAKRCGSSIWIMWQLWSHNQHEVVYQPAPRKPYKESTITMNGQRLQVVDKFTYILEAHCLELYTLMMKSMPGLPTLGHLADYVEVFGIEVVSDLTQSWKSTDLCCCQHYYTHAKLGLFTYGMPKDWTTSIQAVLENF